MSIDIELTKLQNVPDHDLLRHMVKEGADLLWRDRSLGVIWGMLKSKHRNMRAAPFRASYDVETGYLTFVIAIDDHNGVFDDFQTIQFTRDEGLGLSYNEAGGLRTLPHRKEHELDLTNLGITY